MLHQNAKGLLFVFCVSVSFSQLYARPPTLAIKNIAHAFLTIRERNNHVLVPINDRLNSVQQSLIFTMPVHWTWILPVKFGCAPPSSLFKHISTNLGENNDIKPSHESCSMNRHKVQLFVFIWSCSGNGWLILRVSNTVLHITTQLAIGLCRASWYNAVIITGSSC